MALGSRKPSVLDAKNSPTDKLSSNLSLIFSMEKRTLCRIYMQRYNVFF